MRATTILAVRTNSELAIGGDGQVSQSNIIFKQNVKKVRTLNNGKILAGFAGVTSDALAIFDRLENYLVHYPQLTRACVELVRDCRNHSKSEAQLIVADEDKMLLLTGAGDLLEPDDNILGIGSGGSLAVAAARALIAHTSLSAGQIVRSSLEIASGLCIFTNSNITLLTLECSKQKEGIR